MENKPGNQSFTDADYEKFLMDLAPFLRLGETLNAAINDANLQQHKTAIYDKARLKDWFGEKIDIYRAYPGKLANNVLVKIVMQANDKITQGLPVSEDEMKNVRFFAEKSRSAQPYFVNRQETAPGKPVDEVLDELDKKNETINNVAEEAKKALEKQNATQPTQGQVVENQPPIPNQEQAGGNGDIPAQPDATSIQS